MMEKKTRRGSVMDAPDMTPATTARKFQRRHAIPRLRSDQDYALINAGLITAVRDGGRTLVDLDSVDRYHQSLPRVGASPPLAPR